MKVRALTCFLIILCFFTKAYSQSSCPPNLDLEFGNLSNWECFTGYVNIVNGKNQMNLTLSGPVAGRHELMTPAQANELDIYGGFPKLCPFGGNYSVKLGNELTGAQAESMSYTFVVPNTVDTFTFTYFYAVVFEDPQHILPEQPRFFVTAYDVLSGELINCASYDYVSTANLPGFQKSALNPGVLYKNWTPTSLQFAGLGGRAVRLEFRTADCVPTGHFGYAYFDIASACSNIMATAPYCVETNSLILDAPFGFQSYTWYNSDFSQILGTGQSTVLSPPPATQGVFYVDVVPYPGFGCRDTLQAFVKALPVPDTPSAPPLYTLCQNAPPPLLQAKALPGNTLYWYTQPTGGSGVMMAPQPSTATPGVLKYYVAQKVFWGCEGFRKEVTVNVIPLPQPSFTANSMRQCLIGNNFEFTSNSTGLYNPIYYWDFGDTKTDTSTNITTDNIYSNIGPYTVKLKIVNDSLCPSQEKSQIVTLVPKPVAAFGYPSLVCENQTPLTFTDQSSVPSSLSTINKWWWNVNGTILQGQNPQPVTVPPGPLPVQLVVTTPEGCTSDTAKATLPVRYAPVPDFRIGDLLCNNETIHFTDLSAFPPNVNGELIAKWYWTFDNSINVNTKNVDTWFNTGTHTVQLIAENSVGCKSAPLERTFEIHPKPQVALNINDSCVYVDIIYKATDLSGNVAKWKWDFVDGDEEGVSTVTKAYYKEGNRPLTLLTYTDKGCKDTIYRPFVIYDNKSFAGNDTLVAFDEPLQLNAHGEPNMNYVWWPGTGLSLPNIENPVATYDKDMLYKLYTVTEKGCRKQTQIFVKRWAGPELYVPNAFTPNDDGVNDKLKVKPVGFKSFGYFAVYNRWGQQVFRTTDYSKGWDGTVGGKKADAGAYVYVVQAVDYRGKPLHRKGSVILLR